MTSDVRSLDERYLDWLYKAIGPSRNRNPARTYWLLAVELHRKAFEWFVPNDDNRVQDGLELRLEFVEETAAEHDEVWLEEQCSMLEMLIALSRRCAFETSEDPYNWFHVLLDNLGLRAFVDESFDDDFQLNVDVILTAVIDRTYSPDGRGGLFPLKEATQDQREVEIWYQMSSYILENDAS